MKKNLVEIFKEIGHFGDDIGCNDKNGTHTYLETYDKLFEPFRNGCTFMEIGLAMGDSLRLFDKYFTESNIVGVDISIVFDRNEFVGYNRETENSFRIIESDATKYDFLNHIDGQTFDIIIDDGSHMTNDQIDTFNLLKNKLNKNGIYIIEDILALDQEREKYLALHDNCEIIDMRDSGRFDNVLIIYKF